MLDDVAAAPAWGALRVPLVAVVAAAPAWGAPHVPLVAVVAAAPAWGAPRVSRTLVAVVAAAPAWGALRAPLVTFTVEVAVVIDEHAPVVFLDFFLEDFTFCIACGDFAVSEDPLEQLEPD